MTAFNYTDRSSFLQRITLLLAAVVLVCFVLYIGRTLFIPLSTGLFVAFVLYPVCRWLEKKGMSRGLAAGISITLLSLFAMLAAWLLVKQLLSFGSTWPLLREKLNITFYDLGNYLESKWNISHEVQEQWRNQFFQDASSFLIGLVRIAIARSAVSIVMALLVPVYAFLLLLYRQRLVVFLTAAVPAGIKQNIAAILQSAIHTYFRFINGMLVVYLVVGALNSTGLLLLGIPHAILFGFLASVLTFIPYVGIITASLLPITVAWVTYNSIYYPLAIAGIFAFVQYLEANVIFPWAVGNRLNLNTLAVIVVVVAGGILWGGAGMILFIPFAAMVRLVADQLPGGEGLSALLGNGPVNRPRPAPP